MTEIQQRFLKAIAERIGDRKVMEVRLFPAIRQGQHESGVALVAVEEAMEVAVEDPAADGVALLATPEEPAPASATGSGIQLEHPAPSGAPSIQLQPPAPSIKLQPPAPRTQQAVHERYSILTARFRLAVKGPDRGKWDFSLVHDADAPLETIEPVVRGVARRVGDAGEPDLLSPADFQRALSEPWWSATA